MMVPWLFRKETTGLLVYLGNNSTWTHRQYVYRSEVNSGSEPHPDGTTLQFITTTDWERHHIVLDLRSSKTLDEANFGSDGLHPEAIKANNASVVNRLAVRISPGGYYSYAGNTQYYTGFQLEEVPDNVSQPSIFKEPSDGSAIVFGRQITDGKIVTH